MQGCCNVFSSVKSLLEGGGRMGLLLRVLLAQAVLITEVLGLTSFEVI